MSWLDISDEFDPDSAAARDLVMQSLDDAEAEHTVATFTAEPTTARPISYAVTATTKARRASYALYRGV